MLEISKLINIIEPQFAMQILSDVSNCLRGIRFSKSGNTRHTVNFFSPAVPRQVKEYKYFSIEHMTNEIENKEVTHQLIAAFVLMMVVLELKIENMNIEVRKKTN